MDDRCMDDVSAVYRAEWIANKWENGTHSFYSVYEIKLYQRCVWPVKGRTDWHIDKLSYCAAGRRKFGAFVVGSATYRKSKQRWIDLEQKSTAFLMKWHLRHYFINMMNNMEKYSLIIVLSNLFKNKYFRCIEHGQKMMEYWIGIPRTL